MEPTQNLDPAFWIGRSQAFGFVANQCSAAQAECIRMIRDTNAYRSTAPTWQPLPTPMWRSRRLRP